jgi:heat-inducible transcriptional repressor
MSEVTGTEQLSERQRQLLYIVVQEYVQSAQPVGSSTIAQSYDLGVSPATIRNDLAVLEKEGLLTHPHTSAGRLPTDAGYRYFVQYLLRDAELPSQEQLTIRAEFSLARRDLDQWLRLSTGVLARATQNAALATAPRAMKARYKHMELVAIQGTKVLLVLVLQEGSVKQQLLDLDQPMEQRELSLISNELNDQLARCDAAGIALHYPLLTPFARQVALLVADVMERMDNQHSGQLYREGLAQILEAPEFTGSDTVSKENVRKIVQVFEQRSLLEQVLGTLTAGEDVQVVISGDGRYAELQDISLVISRYGAAERASGLLGVVGPLRMPYGRTIGAVRYVAALMSEVVDEIVG